MSDRRPKVRVRVEKVFTNRLIVRSLGKNQSGYIPKREWTWDRSVNAMIPSFEVGQELDVVVIPEKSGEKRLFLSLKEIKDPWKNPDLKIEKDDIVSGEVVKLLPNCAFVQLVPGIDAIVYKQNLPLAKNQTPAKLLSIGDKVQGIVKRINLKARAVEVDILKRLKQLDEKVVQSPEQVFREFIKNVSQIELTMAGTDDSISKTNSTKKHRYIHPVSPLNYALVIDDDPEFQNNLISRLKENKGIESFKAKNGKEGLKILKEEHVDLLIIDINLKNEKGTDVARKIQLDFPEIPVIFVSGDPVGENSIASFSVNAPFALKDNQCEEVLDWVSRITSGYWEGNSGKRPKKSRQSGRFIQQLGMEHIANLSLTKSMGKVASELKKKIRVGWVVIMKVNSKLKTVEIIAESGNLKENLTEQFLDQLYYSPISRVSEMEEPFYADYISPLIDRNFRHFFEGLPYSTCYGVPIKLQGMPVEHVLFAIDNKRDDLTYKQRDQIDLAGQFAQIILEKASMLRFMEKYEEQYIQGQLLMSFFHDFKNKVTGLNGSAHVLDQIAKQLNQATPDSIHEVSKNFAKTSNTIVSSVRDALQMVEGYYNLAGSKFEDVDINEEVTNVKQQMESMARDASVEIILGELAELPKVKAIGHHLRRIISNLILNAIQQIEIQAKHLSEIPDIESICPLRCKRGAIFIETKLIKEKNACQIIIVDTGPGVHHHLQKIIFDLGVTTREKKAMALGCLSAGH